MQTIGRWRVFAAISLFIFVLIGQSPASRGQQPDAQLVANAILQPVAPDNVPETGTFYPLSGFISNNGSLSAPYPFDPATNGVVYSLNTNANTFLVVDVPLTNDDELINALSLLAQQQGPGQRISPISILVMPEPIPAEMARICQCSMVLTPLTRISFGCKLLA